MQISSATLNSGILSPNNQQVTSAVNTSSVYAGVPFISTLTTMGFNSGDNIHWVATGTSVNSTGSAVVTNSLGILGSAVISIPITDANASSSFNVFILNQQVGGARLKEINGISVLFSITSPTYSAGTYGWWGGGWNGSTFPNTPSTVSRIDFTNDTVTALSRGPLSLGRTQLGGAGNASYGWFTGGFNTPATGSLSVVDRIDYANDSPTTASPRGLLTTSRANAPVALSNTTYLWVAGGLAGESSVERITMSNDTIATSPRGNLATTSANSAGTSNSNFGWVTGGNTNDRIDRVEFANDTASASIRGPLSGTRGLHGFAGNNTYGWAMGGCSSFPSPVLSSVERITYANDTATGSQRSYLPAPVFVTAATGNKDYGWVGNGENTGGGYVSTVYRVDYANDTVNATIRSPLAYSIQAGAATSNYVK